MKHLVVEGKVDETMDWAARRRRSNGRGERSTHADKKEAAATDATTVAFRASSAAGPIERSMKRPADWLAPDGATGVACRAVSAP